MTPTKSQQAQEYAEKKIQETVPDEYRHDEQIYDADDIKYAYKQAYSDGYTAAEQSMSDSKTEHTKDEFVSRMQGKLTEQDLTEAKQRTESCVASLSQFELPKQIEAQIDEAMAGIKAESQRQYGNFGAASADIAIPVYRQMMRLGALLALSAGDLESEQTETDLRISVAKLREVLERLVVDGDIEPIHVSVGEIINRVKKDI